MELLETSLFHWPEVKQHMEIILQHPYNSLPFVI